MANGRPMLPKNLAKNSPAVQLSDGFGREFMTLSLDGETLEINWPVTEQLSQKFKPGVMDIPVIVARILCSINPTHIGDRITARQYALERQTKEQDR